MQTQTVKEQVRQAVDGLPDDVTFEEALERIYLRHLVERGRAEADEDEAADDELVLHEFSASSTVSTTVTSLSWRSSGRAGEPD